MSGGVDSSVAAALLKKRGFEVVGVFMKPWSPEGANSKSKILNSKQIPNSKFQIQNFSPCLWRQDREDAMRAASVLGIPFKTWDFSKEYKKSVTDYMVREYKAGRTPNPDVMCNKEIKFGLFYDKAMKEGADYIATGHYARLKREILNPKFEILNKFKIPNFKFKLFMAKDKNKDQSYFLWTLKQKQLVRCLFLVGDYIKPEVRKIAKKFGLPNHDKKDSQGVCFIGPLDMKDFLQTKIKPKSGKILNLAGKVLGTHDGVYYYTIGQRHGLDIGIGGGPYYVVSKNIKKNIIYVGDEKDLYSTRLRISSMSWITDAPKFPAQLDVRLRYRAGLKKAVLRKNGELELKTPERAITSGQSAVFYKKEELLGGGIIE